MGFDSKKFIRFLLDKGCIGFYTDPIKLSSGQESNWYVNLRELQRDFKTRDEYVDFITAFLRSHVKHARQIVGVPDSATLPAIDASEMLGLEEFMFLRQAPKSHGVSGAFPYSLAPKGVTGESTIVLEDTLTTADSAIKVSLNLNEGGAKVNGIVVVCYREDVRWGGELPHRYIEKYMKIPVYIMSRATQILPEAIKRFNPSPHIIDSLSQEYSYNPDLVADITAAKQK